VSVRIDEEALGRAEKKESLGFEARFIDPRAPDSPQMLVCLASSAIAESSFSSPSRSAPIDAALASRGSCLQTFGRQFDYRYPAAGHQLIAGIKGIALENLGPQRLGFRLVESACLIVLA
jgi:hypothetical protein